jgi:hypothetical protein
MFSALNYPPTDSYRRLILQADFQCHVTLTLVGGVAMPRQSAEAAATEVVAVPSPKVAPPDDLTEEQATVWRSITARLPSTWFGSDNTPVLRELCRHVVYSRQLAGELDSIRGKSGPANRKLMLSLLRAHALQSNRIADLSTRLRLTNQSVDRDKAATLRKSEVDGPKPWEDFAN